VPAAGGVCATHEADKVGLGDSAPGTVAAVLAGVVLLRVHLIVQRRPVPAPAVTTARADGAQLITPAVNPLARRIPANAARGSIFSRCRHRRWTSVAVGIAAKAYLIRLLRFWVLALVPGMEPEPILQRLGHVRIVPCAAGRTTAA
jgi:hypothetical protein